MQLKSENIDSNCINRYLMALKSVLVSIRANPVAPYNGALLHIFVKYLRSDEINDIELEKLKKEISSIEGINAEEIECITCKLDDYSANSDILDVDKLKRNINALETMTKELAVLLNKREYDQAYDLADTIHNFPEFLVTDTWDAKSYWNTYIKPYNRKWGTQLLFNWTEESRKLPGKYSRLEIVFAVSMGIIFVYYIYLRQNGQSGSEAGIRTAIITIILAIVLAIINKIKKS